MRKRGNIGSASSFIGIQPEASLAALSFALKLTFQPEASLASLSFALRASG